MSDTEFVKLIIETLDATKFFESMIIPFEIKEIYCQLKNKAVKDYLRHLSLKVEENINLIKMFLTCVGDILESQGTYPSYVKIIKNYSIDIYFNEFLVQAARNCTIIPENSPMKLPLKIAFGVIRDLLYVFFGQVNSVEPIIDTEALKERNEILRKNHMALIIKSIDKVDLSKMDKGNVNTVNTNDIVATIMNIPEIKSELENEENNINSQLDKDEKNVNEIDTNTIKEISYDECDESVDNDDDNEINEQNIISSNIVNNNSKNITSKVNVECTMGKLNDDVDGDDKDEDENEDFADNGDFILELNKITNKTQKDQNLNESSPISQLSLNENNINHDEKNEVDLVPIRSSPVNNIPFNFTADDIIFTSEENN